VFQAFINLGWGKTFRENYFLYRDRIGLISTPMALISGVLFTYALFRHLMGVNFLAMGIEKGYFTASTIDMLKYFVLANVVFMVNRILHRAYFAHTLYGWGHAFMSPVRLILGNIINCFALIKATKQFITSKLTGKAPKWLKTQHIIPVMLPTPGSESQNSPEGAKA
jgi:adsorption protein B